MDNSLHEIVVNTTANVNDLKTQIQEKLNIPINRQRLIFQGKMLKSDQPLSSYKIEDGHVLHLVANLALPNNDNTNNNTTANNTGDNANSNYQSPNNTILADTRSDLELLNGILRTVSETSFNRRNMRRRILQQRTNGFNIDIPRSFEAIRQNSTEISSILHSLTKMGEISGVDNQYINPFNFGERRLHIGQWIDVKDTINQWLEGQVINIRENQAYVHYNGWGSRWDEWIDMNSNRIALFRTHTVQAHTSKFMSPYPNNPPDAENANMPPSTMQFPDILEDTTTSMFKVADMMQELLNKLNPTQSATKSEKSERTTKHDIELQKVISGMIEEQKCQNPHEAQAKSEKNVYWEDTQSVKSHKSVEKIVTFEDDKSVKSHKSLDYDAISLKSIKSYVSASDLKMVNPPLNFPDYISEEDSEERSEIQSNVNIANQPNIRELQASLLSSQLAPLFDRLGRLLVDLSPHIAMLGSSTQCINPAPVPSVHQPINPNLTFASILTNESGGTNTNATANQPQSTTNILQSINNTIAPTNPNNMINTTQSNNQNTTSNNNQTTTIIPQSNTSNSNQPQGSTNSISSQSNINQPIPANATAINSSTNTSQAQQNSTIIPNLNSLQQQTLNLPNSQISPTTNHSYIQGLQTNNVPPPPTIIQQTQSNQNQNNSNQARTFAFQVPIMLTPGEVLTANSTSLTSNRVFGDSNNVENHLNEILNPFRNLPTNPHNTSVSNTGVNTHNLSSPIITRRSTEIRQRLEPMERRDSSKFNTSNISEEMDSRKKTPHSILRDNDQPSTGNEHERVRFNLSHHKEPNMHEISFGTTRQNENTDSDRKSSKQFLQEDDEIPISNSSITSLTSPNKDEKIRIFDSSDRRTELSSIVDHNQDKKDSSCNVSFRSKLSDMGDINTLNPMNNYSSKNLSEESGDEDNNSRNDFNDDDDNDSRKSASQSGKSVGGGSTGGGSNGYTTTNSNSNNSGYSKSGFLNLFKK